MLIMFTATKMKVLHLTLKKKWFDMIASGEKKEEYREVKEYWERRLQLKSFFEPCYTHVYFRNGYSKNAPSMTLSIEPSIDIREGNEEWGAEAGKKYFVIKLGEIVK